MKRGPARGVPGTRPEAERGRVPAAERLAPLPLLDGSRTFGVGPATVAPDEVDEPIHGLGLGDVALDALVTDVEVDAPRAAADVAEVGVGHLSRPVHDAPHDRDLELLQVPQASLDALRRRLQVELRAAAGGAGDEVGAGK